MSECYHSLKAGSQYDVGPTFRFVSLPFPVKPQRHVTFRSPCSQYIINSTSAIGANALTLLNTFG